MQTFYSQESMMVWLDCFASETALACHVRYLPRHVISRNGISRDDKLHSATERLMRHWWRQKAREITPSSISIPFKYERAKTPFICGLINNLACTTNITPWPSLWISRRLFQQWLDHAADDRSVGLLVYCSTFITAR